MYIYIAPLLNKTAFKIGKADSPYKRLSDLSACYEFDYAGVVLIDSGNTAETCKFEHILHTACETCRVAFESDGGTEFFNYEVYDRTIEAARALASIRGCAEVKFIPTEIEPAVSDSTDIMGRLGRMVRNKRLERNLTMSQLAESCGIIRQTLSRLERGENGVTCGVLFTVLTALGMDTLFESVIVDMPRRLRSRRVK